MTAASILIVEDSAADRLHYRHSLARARATLRCTREATSVAEALACLEEEPFDCILLDYQLLDGTGLDLIDALVAREGRLAHPVVMLTGEGSEVVAVQAMKAGVLDYVVKGRANGETIARAIENAVAKGRLQRELDRRAREMEQLAYVVSHDLRAPLRTVHQNAVLLGRVSGDGLGEAASAHLDRILASTRRMESLITGLVDYCRLGGERPFEPVDLGPIVEQALSDLEAQVVEAEAEIEIGALPWVSGDATRLRQLFQNLIGNALKFRGEDPPHVVVEAHPEDDKVRVSVADNGRGIAPADFERIFGVFQRLPGAADTPGTGIGLATCRRIAELHGGSIDVSSMPGVGTTFSLLLTPAGAEKEEEAH